LWDTLISHPVGARVYMCVYARDVRERSVPLDN